VLASTLLRFAVIAAVAVRIVLATHGNATASSLIVAVAMASAAAFAIVTERRAALRHVLLGIVVALHLASVLYDGGWRTDWFVTKFALMLLAESALIVPFLETRWWRWSLAPGLLLAAWLTYHLFPGYANAVVSRHAVWLAQALVLLIANAAVRSIRDEDAAAVRS
jgi:hypothetical protein